MVNWLLSLVVVLPVMAKTQFYVLGVRESSLSHRLAEDFQQQAKVYALQKSQHWNLASSEDIPQVVEVLPTLGLVIVKADQKDESFIWQWADWPNVAYVYPEFYLYIPEPVDVSFQSFKSLMDLGGLSLKPTVKNPFDNPTQPYGIEMVKAPRVWAKGFEGQGIKVAVIDSGVDAQHPVLQPALKMQVSFLLEDITNPSKPVEDTVGHGTHVAGTILGRRLPSGFVGVAPKAELYSARVCNRGCNGMAILAALEWAAQLKVQVVNMSLGGPTAVQPLQDAVEKLDQLGIAVVAAAGNDGANKVSYPAAYPTVLAVGAVDENKQKASFSNWGPELAVVAPGVSVVSSVPRGSGRFTQAEVAHCGQNSSLKARALAGSADAIAPLEAELVYAGYGRVDDFKGLSVKGKVALVERGEIRFIEKAQNAYAAGAVAVVVYNNVDEEFEGGALTQDGSKTHFVVIGINRQPGLKLRQALEQDPQNPVTIRIQTLKTDYAALSGTSMASPHVAGVVALLRQANSQLTPAQLKKILQDTADPLPNVPQEQVGAGLVNAEKALALALTVK